MPDWNPKANELFLKALEIEDAAARAAFLAGFPAEVRQQAEALLQAHADAGNFLNPPQLPTDIHVPQETAGTVIAGKYKLLERIGEGGMGSVWMADQLQPVKRRVAVKLIKTGMDSKSVLARFEAERQALAMMDHPNIAKILDGGITGEPGDVSPGSLQGEPGGVSPGILSSGSGTPYFVMELVKGTTITKFCDARKLSVQERLELFVPVCQAIQHAHMKGIIHRDIKPSNVLVALYDDKPVPKVIDFGIAKAAGQPLTDRTLATGFGAIVGTPEYMSPEQASFNQLDVDTRSDVYSLGVLLYELLTGAPPIERAAFAQGAILKILEMVREVEPPRPSTKFSTRTAPASIAALRGLEPSRLAKLLRGELDWVVMKALEKDRTRRYESANGLGSDVQRYLAGEAVMAVPPSAGYRMRKFVKKHKPQVIAGMAVAAALICGMIGTTWQAYRAAQKTEELKAEEARTKEALALAERQTEIITLEQTKTKEALALAENNASKAELALIHGYIQPMGHNKYNLDPVEIVAFEDLSKQSDHLKLLFLKEVMTDPDIALRLSRRSRLIVQSVVGISPIRRQCALEITENKLANTNLDTKIHLFAYWFAGTLGKVKTSELGKRYNQLKDNKIKDLWNYVHIINYDDNLTVQLYNVWTSLLNTVNEADYKEIGLLMPSLRLVASRINLKDAVNSLANLLLSHMADSFAYEKIADLLYDLLRDSDKFTAKQTYSKCIDYAESISHAANLEVDSHTLYQLKAITKILGRVLEESTEVNVNRAVNIFIFVITNDTDGFRSEPVYEGLKVLVNRLEPETSLRVWNAVISYMKNSVGRDDESAVILECMCNLAGLIDKSQMYLFTAPRVISAWGVPGCRRL